MAVIPVSSDILGQANYLSSVLRDFFFYIVPGGLMFQGLLGGYDVINKEFEIYQLWSDGGQRKVEFDVVGSGTDFAGSVLMEKKSAIEQRKLNLYGAIELSVKAILRAGQKDGGSSDIRLAIPTVAVVTEEGYREINPSVVRRVTEILIRKEGSNV